MTDLPLPLELDPHSKPGETKYVTERGASVRILSTDMGGEFPILGARWSEERHVWDEVRLRANGIGLRLRPRRPEPREWWVNDYGEFLGPLHKSKEDADRKAGNNRLACIRVREVLEGDDD